MGEATGALPSGGRRFVVEGFEGELVVLSTEGGIALDLPREWVPAEAGEGDLLVAEARVLGAGRVEVRFTIDHEASEAARRAVREQLARLRGER
jgi:hypothetical protein